MEFSVSLGSLVSESYVDAVVSAASLVQGRDSSSVRRDAHRSISFDIDDYFSRCDSVLSLVGANGHQIPTGSQPGAGTASFNAASKLTSAPLSGFGCVRAAEDGRCYLSSKAEHYHASLGLGFPGYDLIHIARSLGIPNATHNNTRGVITRTLEGKLVAAANGIDPHNTEALNRTLGSEGRTLNRVLNLETGSLAVEAGVKMMLARFYKLDKNYAEPPYQGKTPVFLVMADNNGGLEANYHGTTVITQCMRGMWPGFAEKLEQAGVMAVRSVRPNDTNHFREVLEEYDKENYKVAGFLHEIVLMNYGGILLERSYLQDVYAMCRQHDVPVLVDEIQSCMWYPGFFLFREYGLEPDFVAVGKGFPGGEYPASRIITTPAMDSLNQFGALVTNGQEELASLAYLITMAFGKAIEKHIIDVGEYYKTGLIKLSEEFPDSIDQIEGKGHLSSIFFHTIDQVISFTKELNAMCIDISAHTYKANCPPAALTKLPLVATRKTVDFLMEAMRSALG